jgi:hydrogenase small subunit
MDEPPGGKLSSGISKGYGTMIRKLRHVTNKTLNEEPKWRKRGQELLTGYRR